MSQPPWRCFSLLIFVLTIFSTKPSSASTSCSSSFHCPPFNSSPPYPFSASPGCGHPNFQIQCSSSRATITIKNLTFSILHYSSISSSLTLSPITNTNRNTNNCSSLRFSSSPNRFIDLTGSPFRVSDSSCSRLSLLRPCSPFTLPNCSRCPWDCKLLKNPGRILHGCESTHGSLSEQGCQGDLLGFLQDFFTRFGFEVEWDESQDPYFIKCRDCQIKNGVCGFNSTHPNQDFICFHKSRSELVTQRDNNKRVNHIAVLSLIFALTCLLLVFSVAVAIFRSRRASFLSSINEEDPAALFLRHHRSAALLPPVFTFEELESATNKFDPKRKIGDGGFGSVYLGQLSDGQLLAVKFLHHHHAFSMKSFCNEILILSSINHPNLVKLHGYCSDPRGLLLVHDYVTNGTLADHLHGRGPKMTWRVRLDIALQTALAMEYLHFDIVPPVVHRDITSSNIFVEKDMKIKVGDFGLSRLLVFSETTVNSATSSDYVCTGPQGTPGYLDPDYHRSFRLTEKSDVYSYGVVLMELITGMKAVDQRREKRDMALADLVVSKIQMGLLDQVIDPLLALDGDDVAAVSDGFGVAAVAELAFRCVATDKDDRPDAKEIVQELRRIRSHTRVADDDVAKN
ncbi:putative protein kinase; 23181-21271 [Arabidopsis thaliana]|nr:putative protein kinase; 23181-21271 [Arabidopsis thaliana]